MAEPLANQVLRKIGEVCSLYHRLILMVGPAGSGKASALKEVSARALQQDPLRLLQGLPRNKTVVAAWNGTIVDGYLTYAGPSHPEYRRYPIRDLEFPVLEAWK
ncbi:BREX-3 system P-loop-containing protein BrxF [Coriobacteriia bacterium Es71-Z0120]|nr:BREX-3 system P-loop-containing protein BrxF [Parvivirga hydrogeniphila]